MLTRDLVRCRITGDHVAPVYLRSGRGSRDARLAGKLLARYSAGVGNPVCDVRAQVMALADTPAEVTMLRGLAKLAEESAVVAPPAQIDASALRAAVFTLAARYGPHARRDNPQFLEAAGPELAAIAATFGIARDDLFLLLFADLAERRVLLAFDPELTAADLIARYNEALAQALLHRATRLVVDLEDGYRTVFKYLKLAGLMHTVEAREHGYRITLDGPLSLLSQVARYGVAMARLLPAVLLCRRWRLTAQVRVGTAEKRFTLSPRDGLVSHYPQEAVFDSELEAAFHRRFTRAARGGWTIAREAAILDLGDTVLLPDFTFVHQDGRVAHLEIVGFWTADYLRRKLDKLRRLDAPDLIVAIPERRDCSLDGLAGPLLRFKTRVLLRDLLPALEKAGAVHSSGRDAGGKVPSPQ